MSTKHKVVVATAALLVVGTGTAAYAYWSTSGAGTGSAVTSGGAADLTVTQTAAPTDLAPGVAPGAISVSVKNNAANDVQVNQVVVSITGVTAPSSDATHPCSAADYALSNPTMTSGAGVLAAGSTVSFSGASLAFNPTAANQDGCKGATVQLAYAVS